MAIASAFDLAFLRTDCGSIGRVTDQAISDRVYSYRLADQDAHAAWTFRPGNSWKSFCASGITTLHRGEHTHMSKTDIANYYPTIQIDLLQELLLRQRCDPAAVNRVIRTLRFWRQRDNLQGLPIGPEASAVLGNFFLTPLDQALIFAGADHKRYGDDILIFAKGRLVSETFIAVVDDELNSLELVRSEEKTKYFENPEEAEKELRDSEMDYLDDVGTYSSQLGMRALMRAFDQYILGATELSRSRVRYILNRLKKKNQPYRCSALLRRQELMNIDPKVSCSYVSVGLSDNRVIDELMKIIEDQPQDRLEALKLHSLLAMSNARTGRDEARQFERIASDPSRPWPTRSMAWKARAHSD